MSFWADLQSKFRRTSNAKKQFRTSQRQLNDQDVYGALQKVNVPGLGKSVVAAGLIASLEIKNNIIRLTLTLPTAARTHAEAVRREAIQHLSELAGVAGIQVVMDVPTTDSAPKTKAQAQRKPGPQGSAIPDTSASLGKVKNIIAVASGKGGVGKSTTTVNLAYSLAASGAKVGILDADIYGPSIPKMTAVGNPEHMSNDLVVPPQSHGVKVISVAMFSSSEAPNAAMLRGPMVAQIIRQFLTQVAWGELDYLLIDYPPGTGDIQLTLSQMAPISGAVLVTTPQEVALLDVRKALTMFQTVNIPVIGVIETMSYFLCEGSNVRHYIFGKGGGTELASAFKLPFLGEVPLEASVASLADQGKPVVTSAPESAASQAFSKAAHAIAEHFKSSSAETGLNEFRIQWKN